MSSPKLTDFKVLVFDTYGTLADWESGIYNGMKPLLAKYPAASSWTREEALKAFSSVEADLQANHPEWLYCDLLAKSHEALEERLKATSDAPSAPSSSNEHIAFGQSIKDWPAFPDSSAALHLLSKYYKLVVLSNVDRNSYGWTLAKLSEGDSKGYDQKTYTPPPPGEFWFPQHAPGSKSPFTLIVTAQDVKSYKPAHHGFNVTLDLIQKHPDLLNDPEGKTTKEKVLWVAQSVFHDIVPATELGMKTVWINRKGASMGSVADSSKATWVFNTLGEMAEAVEKE